MLAAPTAYPDQEVKDFWVTWPDMRESFPCERKHYREIGCGGENPAEWILSCSHCCPPTAGLHVFYCSTCKDQLLAQTHLVCRFCRTKFEPPSEAYLSITPLNLDRS